MSKRYFSQTVDFQDRSEKLAKTKDPNADRSYYINIMKGFLLLILCLSITQIFSTKAEAVELLIVANSRHLSFVVPMSSVPDALLPSDINYRNDKYLDIGMGQDPYFYKKNPSILDALKAIILKSPSVIRLHPFSLDPQKHFSGKSILTLEISQRQLALLLKYVQKDFDQKKEAVFRNEEDQKFYYKGLITYSRFNTCVTWVVHGLGRIGLSVDQKDIPHFSIMDVFNQIAHIPQTKSIYRNSEEI